MGLCRDFGSQIAEGCDHPMRADSDSCHCEECGVVCTGRFEACPAVWAQGPQPVVLVSAAPDDMLQGPNWETHTTNGHEAPAAASPGPAVAEAAKTATNGHMAVSVATDSPLPAASSGSEPAAEAFRWFQNAFDALRLEVAGLRTALAQEQTLVATLLEVRVAETDRDSESGRALLEATVREAVKQDALGIAPALEALRNDIQAVRSTQEKLEAGLQAAADYAGAARAELPAELSRRDSANRKAFRATLDQELQPLVDVIADSVAQSEYHLEVLDRRLDKLTESGESLAAAVDALSDAGSGTAAESEPEPQPVRSRLRERATGGVEASVLAARGTVSRAGTAASRRPATRAGVGKIGAAAGGHRVSLRPPPSDA